MARRTLRYIVPFAPRIDVDPPIDPRIGIGLGPGKRFFEEGHQMMVEFNKRADATDLSLKALRINGQLAYMTKDGKMEKITKENAPWSSEMPKGSHRYPFEWVADRHTWLVDGKPARPDW